LERLGNTKITIYDDLEPELDSSIKDILHWRPEIFKLFLARKKNIEDFLRPNEPWEQNPHCLKSICKKVNKTEKNKTKNDWFVSVKSKNNGSHSVETYKSMKTSKLDSVF